MIVRRSKIALAILSVLVLFVVHDLAFVSSVSLTPSTPIFQSKFSERGNTNNGNTLVRSKPLRSNNNNIVGQRGGGVVGDVFQTFINTVKESKGHLAAAAVARSISIFAMYPVDTIKTRMQMDLPNPLKVQGLYKGVGGSLFGQVPYGVLTFGSYEMYKKALFDKFPKVKPIFLYAFAAILGDVTGSGWLCPSEVVKQQLQAGMYPSTTAAVRGILQKKGWKGFYQGYVGGLTRDVPFRVAQLTSYELTKNFYMRLKKKKMEQENNGSGEVDDSSLSLSSAEAAICGAVAGSFSAGITAPLDRIKTLLMTDNGAYGGTVASCVAKIWKDEGIAGFMQGVVPRVTYIAPSVAIFFLAYERVQDRFN